MKKFVSLVLSFACMVCIMSIACGEGDGASYVEGLKPYLFKIGTPKEEVEEKLFELLGEYKEEYMQVLYNSDSSRITGNYVCFIDNRLTTAEYEYKDGNLYGIHFRLWTKMYDDDERLINSVYETISFPDVYIPFDEEFCEEVFNKLTETFGAPRFEITREQAEQLVNTTGPYPDLFLSISKDYVSDDFDLIVSEGVPITEGYYLNLFISVGDYYVN
ncbi:MAG: hypothetical protein IJ153_09025 [Clostridia bacterium]|nr:hypothetical protein [Clostridia bacterium]